MASMRVTNLLLFFLRNLFDSLLLNLSNWILFMFSQSLDNLIYFDYTTFCYFLFLFLLLLKQDLLFFPLYDCVVISLNELLLFFLHLFA
jgi:hypothetical protein